MQDPPVDLNDEWIIPSLFVKPQYAIVYSSDCGADENNMTISRKPVSYKSGGKIKIEAQILTDCPTKVRVKAEGHISRLGSNDTTVIHFKFKDLNPNNGILKFNRKAEESLVADMVQYVPSFLIKYYISMDEGNTWKKVSQSQNVLYVTHSNPRLGVKLPRTAETILFHTSLHIGCINANGLTDKIEIVNSIYHEAFGKNNNSTPTLYRQDGAGPFTYWGPNNQNPLDDSLRTVIAFLHYVGACCGEFAEFFDDIIRVQGINGSKVSIVLWTKKNNASFLANADITRMKNDIMSKIALDSTSYSNIEFSIDTLKTRQPDGSETIETREKSFFFVHNWETDTSLFSVSDILFQINHFLAESYTLSSNFILKKLWSDGVSGQGNNDPRSTFGNHALVKFDNKYYDPSYGSPPVSKEIYIQNTFAGFGSSFYYTIDINGTLFKLPINWFGYRSIDSLPHDVTINP